MKAAGLKDIDTVITSTAILIKNKSSKKQEMIDLIASRIRGVISTSSITSGTFIKFFMCLFCTSRHSFTFSQECYYTVYPLTCPFSRTKIRPLPVQHRPQQPRHRERNHTRQTCPNHHSIRHARLGSCQLDGGEETRCEQDGRADEDRGDRYLSAGHCQLEDGLD